MLYGQRHHFGGVLERTEPFSWTAPGAPWINHEIGAEWVMALAHLWGGSRGLWILMILVGAATLTLAGWEAATRVSRGHRWLVWAIIALSSREVALGFAMRPQIFSALAWILLLVSLRYLGAGRRWPVAAIPLLCILWINTHGGVLLAVVVLVVLVGATLVVVAVRRHARCAAVLARWTSEVGWDTWSWSAYGATAVLAAGALFANPYGWRLPAWLIGSVAYTRPEISEWNPTSLDATHAIFWLLALAWVWALMQRRARVPGWEAIVGTLLLVAAARHERHVPLFALTMIAFLPGCVSRWMDGRHVPKVSAPALSLIAVLLGGTAALGVSRIVTGAAVSGPLGGRMQVSTEEYPVGAIRFVRAAGIKGNAVIYFDWAQQALWELPDSSVSFDGRLDTCYPRALIAEHWDFFHRGVLPARTFSLHDADWMLLPRGSEAVAALGSVPSWRRAYMDTVAEVFVNTDRGAVPESIWGAKPGSLGDVVAFPDQVPGRADELRRR
ncbi:MAG: hypothetical protein HYZ36_08240 [Pedosphaera parvula]|nr:hypothetical protein [Pedosphaera parvula]